MRTTSTAVLGVLVAAVLVTGCGGDDDASDADEGASSSSSSDDTAPTDDGDQGDQDDQDDSDGGSGALPDPCDLVSIDELSEVLGREVVFDESASGDQTCAYLTNGAGAIVFSIDVFPASGDADEVIGEVLDLDPDAEPLDLGEAGYVSGTGAQVGFIQDGINYQINLGGLADDPSADTIAVAELVDAAL